MKTYKVIMLPSARDDLAEITDYLSQFYKNTAIKQYDRIIKKINMLKEFPLMCEEYNTFISDFNYRKMVVDDYLIFYVVLADMIEIHNIINAKMDISKWI